MRYTVYKKEYPRLTTRIDVGSFRNFHLAAAYARQVLNSSAPYTMVGVWDNEEETVVTSW